LEFGEAIRRLGAKYPQGLARLAELPEERSGEVNRTTVPPEPDYALASGIGEDGNSNGSGPKGKRGIHRASTPSIFPELVGSIERDL
jgi:hypothetical protein